MRRRRISVLLVGPPTDSLELLLWLYKKGCLCYFAASSCDAAKLISCTEFDLVLSQDGLPDQLTFPLTDRLVGTRTTLFSSTETDSGSLWMPILERGKCRTGAPMLLPRELVVALEGTLSFGAISDRSSPTLIAGFELQNNLREG